MEQEWKIWNKKGTPVDEGLMHRCAMLAGLSVKDAYLPDHWSRGHFHPLVNDARFVHIRKGKRELNGDVINDTVSKLENYLILNKTGII